MMEILKNKMMVGFVIFFFGVVIIGSYQKPVSNDTMDMLVTTDHIIYENEYFAQK